jgi:CCR4-NOT transcription complex subunit 7/8
MDRISRLVHEYNYISMDTEYPGTVYVPTNTENEFEYNMIKANCDNLKLIQVGISMSNVDGETPPG